MRRMGSKSAPTFLCRMSFKLRQEAAARGQNYATPLTLVLSGPANNAPPLYSCDKNNFQPRVAVAWSPSFRPVGFLVSYSGAITSQFFAVGLPSRMTTMVNNSR